MRRKQREKDRGGESGKYERGGGGDDDDEVTRHRISSEISIDKYLFSSLLFSIN